MVDPKKDYEQLMRYLQGGAQKGAPATVPEQTYNQEWQLPAPATVNQPDAPVKTVVSKPPIAVRTYPFHWPKWKGVTLHKKARFAIAAVAALILVVLLWNAYTFYQLSPDTIYNKVYVPFNPVAPQGKAPVIKNNIAQYYASGNYVAATLLAKKQKPLSDEEKLLAGLSYLQREDFSSAIKWLEPLSNNFKSPYRQQAEFYVALTYLRNEDFDRCIEKMEHIAYTPTHLYHDQISKSIIHDIKMLKWK